MAPQTLFLLFVLISLTVAQTGIKPSPKAEEGSDAFLERLTKHRLDLCEGTPGERKTSVYVFNLANPEEFLSSRSNAKAVFEEIGPFVFKETVSRKNCRISLDDLSVDVEVFRERQLESPSSDLEVPLTTVNIAFPRFAKVVLKDDPLGSIWLKDFIDKGEGYLKKDQTVKDLLIDGYDISKINSYLRDRHPMNLTELQVDRLSPFQELFYPESLTLQSDPETFGQISALDGKDMEPESCNFALATDGVFFPGNVTKATVLNFYSEDLCSNVPIVFKESVTHGSLNALKFVFSEDTLKKAACDCVPSPRYPDLVKVCFPTGGVDVKMCQKNRPYVASLPHFLNADPKYTTNLTGLSASDASHQSYFIIEPVTGSVLESSLKFQLNVNLLKLSSESFLGSNIGIQDTIFPTLWTDKKFTLAEEKVLEIQNYLEELTRTTAATTTAAPTTATAAPTTAENPVQTTAEATTPTTARTTERKTEGTTLATVATSPVINPTTAAPSPASEILADTILRRINDLSRSINLFVHLIYTVVAMILVGFVCIFLLAQRRSRQENQFEQKL